MTSPLVTIAIPSYNAAQTLPIALASLLAQTYQNWECIVVDDGSTDNTTALITTLIKHDNRFRLITLDKNSGRAIARQKALDHAQGQYLAMVDADDWIYPSKIEDQVHILETHPALALVSCGMVLVDYDNNLLGIRSAQSDFLVYPPTNGPKPLPVAHATSMIRLDIARTAGYNFRLLQNEDADFLLRLLTDNPFAVVGDVQYAYVEQSHSTNIDTIIRAQTDLLNIYCKYLRRFPFSTCRQVGLALLKLLLAYGSKITGLEKKITKLRAKSNPTDAQTHEFNLARQRVLEKHKIILAVINAQGSTTV